MPPIGLYEHGIRHGNHQRSCDNWQTMPGC
jgi:hypothetical protein